MLRKYFDVGQMKSLHHCWVGSGLDDREIGVQYPAGTRHL